MTAVQLGGIDEEVLAARPPACCGRRTRPCRAETPAPRAIAQREPVSLAPRVRAEQQPALTGEAGPRTLRSRGSRASGNTSAEPDVAARHGRARASARPCRNASRPSADSRSPAPAPARRATPARPARRPAPSTTRAWRAGSPAGHSRAKLLERAMPPDDSARQQHRAAGAVALLVDDGLRAELPGSRGGDEAGHAGTGDVEPRSGEREGGLVLDVLELHAVGPPDEDAPACSARRPRRRSRCRAPRRRRCAPRPSRRGRRRG